MAEVPANVKTTRATAILSVINFFCLKKKKGVGRGSGRSEIRVNRAVGNLHVLTDKGDYGVP